MHMGTHPRTAYRPAAGRRAPDGFDRLVAHYDGQLSPLSVDVAYRAVRDLRVAIEDLRVEGLDKDGPAMERFALAWRRASRLVALAALKRRPPGVSMH